MFAGVGRVDRNFIVVSGIPPDDAFNTESIMKKVRKYDNGAKVVPPKTLAFG